MTEAFPSLTEEDAQLTDEVEEQDSSAQIAKHAPAEADIKGVPDGCIVLGGKVSTCDGHPA